MAPNLKCDKPQQQTSLSNQSAIHLPVLVDEAIQFLDPQPGAIIIDCTFGVGQHARKIAELIGSQGTLIAIDRDPSAIARAQQLAKELHCHVRIIHSSFQEALEQLIEEGCLVDGIFFDLGISSPQIDTDERGFAYSRKAPLDMRMNPDDELTAATIVNTWSASDLADLFRRYGEERYARNIARFIIRAREVQRLTTTTELVELIKKALPPAVRFQGGHPAKRVFQALRIAVNSELEQIEQSLPLALSLLKPEARLVVIAFHSLEDRIVKHFFAECSRECICPPGLPVCGCGHHAELQTLTTKVIRPTEQEQTSNSRSASARLRAAKKIGPVL